MTRPRLFVTGDVAGAGQYHLGDEAMLEANLRNFRRLVPGIRFTVSSRDPAWTSMRYSVDALPSPHLRTRHPDVPRPGMASEPALAMWAAWLGDAIAREVRASDGLLISGGGNLSDTWPAHIWERVALMQVATAAGKPVVVVGQTIGPSLGDHARRWLGASLSSCAWVGVREASSAVLAEQIGVPEHLIDRQLDDAFFIEPDPVDDDRAKALPPATRPWILVTLDPGFGSTALAQVLSRIAAQLDALAEATRGHLVFGPHVGGADLPEADTDAAAARALRAHLRSPLVILDTWQPREMRWLAGQAAVVVSTRYHPLVFATAAGTPALGIHADAYTRTKLCGALAHAGLDRWCLPVDEAGRDGLLPLAMALWREREDVARRLAEFTVLARPRDARRWEGICRALRLEPADAPAAP